MVILLFTITTEFLSNFFPQFKFKYPQKPQNYIYEHPQKSTIELQALNHFLPQT